MSSTLTLSISRFNKFSQATYQQIGNLYYNIKYDTKGTKWTKFKLHQDFNISRVQLDEVLQRHKHNNGVVLPKSRINHRYQTQYYKDKRRQKLIDKEMKQAQRKALRELKKKSRYEHKLPNDMLHIDLKQLSPIQGEKIIKGQKQYLLAVVDDNSRQAHFEIIDGKNMYQVKSGLERVFARMPLTNIKSILSDNGKEFKGKPQQHQVELLLQSMGIKHYYTKVRRPQTNGKVERINRTVSEEFLTKIHFNSRIERELQLRYYEYHYNNHRPHQGINNQTPNQKYQSLSFLKM
jgi:transposase InsO family protein